MSCIGGGAGASTTVGLPVWSRLLKRICHTYFEQWALKIASEKEFINHPPSNVSIALTNSYELCLLEQKNSELMSYIENAFENAEYWVNERKLSEEESKKSNETMKQSYKLVHKLQDSFMNKIMSGDLTIIAQMIKNQVRPWDWNYLIRKSLYSSYDYKSYVLNISLLYQELIELVKKYNISNIINYNYDDTFFHCLKQSGLKYRNCYGSNKTKGNKHIFYPHVYIPMCSNANYYTHYAFLPSSGDDQASIMYDNLCDTDLYRLGIKVIRYSSRDDHKLLPRLIRYLVEF